MSIKYKSAVLFVQDIARSRQFYEGVLGQTVEMDFGANVGYLGGFAIWQIDSVNDVVFGQPDHCIGPQGNDNVELYFETTDLDGVNAALAAAGVPVLQPLHEQPWGQRALRITDPDRHIVEIGEPMTATIKRLLDTGQSVATIAARTAMPLEVVQYVVDNGTFPTA